MRQQLAAVSSLQRQRSAALIGEWKRTELAAKNLTAGIQPLGQSIRNLSTTIATLQGPLGGIAGRLSSTATLLSSVSAESAAAGASMAGLAGPAALVAAGMAASAIGVGLLGKALFGAAQSAAEFQGKMFDLAQQTGVNVETLSALEILATTTGGSIESIAQSLVIFQGKLDEAQDTGSKAARQFKVLGIETKNTEDAFRQALTVLSRMPEGFHQTNQAAELFGRRGGKQVLAILKESHGDLDGTIKRFRDLGIVITEADAKLADEFNDQLAILQFQLRSVGAVIGKEIIPVALTALRDLSKAFRENREAINDVAKAAGLLSNLFTGPLKGAIFAATIAWSIQKPFLVAIAEAYERIAAASQLITGRGLGPGGNIPAIPLDTRVLEVGGTATLGIPRKKREGGGGIGRRAARDTALEDATTEAALAEREALVLNAADVAENKRALDEQVRDIEDFTRRAIELADARQDAAIVRINAEQEALDTALQRKVIKQREYNAKSRELAIQNTEADQRHTEEKFQLEQERDRKISEARIAAKNRELQIAEDADQRHIQRIQDRVDQEVLLEAEAEQQIAEITAEAFERRRKALEEESDAYSTTLERRTAITDELIRLEGERAGAAEEASRRIRNALQQEAREQKEALEKLRERTKDIERDSAGTAIDLLILNFARRREVVRAEFNLRKSDEERRHNQELDFIAKQRAENEASARTQEQKNERTKELNRLEEAEAERHRLRMKEIKDKAKQDEKATDPIGRIGLDVDNLKEFARVIEDSIVPLGELLTRTFLDVADAIGQTVATWVLLGKTGPAVMRKILAQALASIAAEAAVNAIKELALGFATLFLNPAEAGAHFAAAGLWASIAGVSAIAGRAVAGNLFQPQESGAGGGRGGTNERGEPRPIDLTRTQRGEEIHIFVHAEPAAQFDNAVVRALVTNVTRNGEGRKLIVDTAAAA